MKINFFKCFCSVLIIFSVSGCKFSEEPEIVLENENISSENQDINSRYIENENKEILPLHDKLIVIDPGHGLNNNSSLEPVSPGSSKKKPANVSGTAGRHQTEEQFNLKLSYKLKESLENLGAEIVMTRYTNKTYLTNIERAELANDLESDMNIKIHADGSDNLNADGMSILVPFGDDLMNPAIKDPSRKCANIVLEKMVEKTGAKNRGLSSRSDMTGFNWSNVPVILIEAGFMSNPKEENLLFSDDYQNKIVDGICDGLVEYFKNIK